MAGIVSKDVTIEVATWTLNLKECLVDEFGEPRLAIPEDVERFFEDRGYKITFIHNQFYYNAEAWENQAEHYTEFNVYIEDMYPMGDYEAENYTLKDGETFVFGGIAPASVSK